MQAAPPPQKLSFFIFLLQVARSKITENTPSRPSMNTFTENTLSRPSFGYEGGFLQLVGGIDNDGMPNGKVRFVYDGEIVYEGTMRAGEEHGFGKLIWPDGVSYEGQFEHGKMKGDGIVRDPNGNIIYYGSYHPTFTYHGVGRKNYNDGSVYFGAFKHGMRHGKGTMTYQNGDKYDGSWKNDARHGNGTFEFANGGDIISGKWNNDANPTLSAIVKFKDTLDELTILQDTVTPLMLSVDRWQSVADKLHQHAIEAGVDPIVLRQIIDERL